MTIRDQKLNARVTEVEFEAVKVVAEQEGLSLSDFVRKAVRDAGVRTMSATAAKLKVGVSAARPRRKKIVQSGPPPSADELAGVWKTPFMRKEDAEAFERVIRASALSMRCSQLSAARLVTFLLEEIAKEVASGKLVRLPGFGVFGPYASENASGVEGCLPRFVSAAPFRDFIQYECHVRDNRNKELKAAQRRRRKRPSSVISTMETIRAHIGAQNRKAQDLYEASSLDGWIARGGE